MNKHNSVAWNNRSLVTETLPYEVPVIFGNDKFFYATTRIESDVLVAKALKKIHQRSKHHTIPYQYSIRKDSARTTELSIIHPLWQLEICDFYKQHEGSLLSHCAKSAFSLRRPVAIASLYTDTKPSSISAAPKTGIVESADEGSIDTSHIVSYFAYANYNLLSRFYESPEFIRLEKRFRYMKTLDISKCFYHIYTHSISWAVKDKAFAKSNSTAHSFEGRFDQLMQRANYNETNGIVVGPEFSRVFAEIILQRVDANVEKRLRDMGFVHEQNYAIRRYVDDYSIFSGSIEKITTAQEVIADELGKMKLYLNEKKIQLFERPFVTPLTLARTELARTLKGLDNLLSDDSGTRYATVRDVLREARTIVSRHHIDFGSVSGWILSSLNRIVLRANGSLFSEKENAEKVRAWTHIVRSTLELSFHLCALDFRVRTSYSICQIINSIYKAKKIVSTEYFDEIEHKLCEELIQLIDAAPQSSYQDDSVEIYNIFITGSHFMGKSFTKTSRIRQELNKLLSSKFTYFKFITLTFCFLTDQATFSEEIKRLTDTIEIRLSEGADIQYDAEQFLMLSDYLSSPLIENKTKMALFSKLFGGSISNATMNRLAEIVGFVEWTDINVDHLLRRKELRPVYAVA